MLHRRKEERVVVEDHNSGNSISGSSEVVICVVYGTDAHNKYQARVKFLCCRYNMFVWHCFQQAFPKTFGMYMFLHCSFNRSINLLHMHIA